MKWPDPNTEKPSWVLFAEGHGVIDDDEREEFPDLMTSQQAAIYIGTSKSFVNRLARSGKLPFTREWRVNRFLKADLDVYLAGRGAR